MIYYVAYHNSSNAYICINSKMQYVWVDNLQKLTKLHFLECFNKDSGDETIEKWLELVPKHNMVILFSFTSKEFPHLKSLYPEFYV